MRLKIGERGCQGSKAGVVAAHGKAYVGRGGTAPDGGETWVADVKITDNFFLYRVMNFGWIECALRQGIFDPYSGQFATFLFLIAG